MVSATSIVPEVGQGLCLPRFLSPLSLSGATASPKTWLVSILNAIPFGCRGQAFTPLREDYNYKSSVQVTGCNLHRGRERAVEGHP